DQGKPPGPRARSGAMAQSGIACLCTMPTLWARWRDSHQLLHDRRSRPQHFHASRLGRPGKVHGKRVAIKKPLQSGKKHVFTTRPDPTVSNSLLLRTNQEACVNACNTFEGQG